MSPGAWRVALALALAVHLAVLYWPRPPAVAPGVPGLDLVVHVVVFGALALCAVRAGLPVRGVVAVLLAHAVLSEVLQETLVPDRTGDWRDALADAVGTVAGTAAGAVAGRRGQRVAAPHSG